MASAPRNTPIHTRMADHTVREAKAAAERAGVNLSQYIHDAVLDRMQGTSRAEEEHRTLLAALDQFQMEMIQGSVAVIDQRTADALAAQAKSASRTELQVRAEMKHQTEKQFDVVVGTLDDILVLQREIRKDQQEILRLLRSTQATTTA